MRSRGGEEEEQRGAGQSHGPTPPCVVRLGRRFRPVREHDDEEVDDMMHHYPVTTRAVYQPDFGDLHQGACVTRTFTASY